MTSRPKRGLPKLGQGARIIVAGDSHPLQITSRISAVGEDGLLSVRPLTADAAKDLGTGVKVTLEYFLDDAVYQLTTHVRGVGTDEDAGVVFLAPPEAVKKLQRRRFPRLSIQLQASLLHVELPLGFDQDGKVRQKSIKQWGKAVTKQGAPALSEAVSASGVRLACAQSLEEGATVFVRFAVDGENLNVAGLVTWVGRAQTAGFELAYGIEFVAIDEDERKRIADFVHSRAT